MRPPTERRACEDLDAYIGGWLGESALLEFERHLPACPSCREELLREERVEILLAGARLHPEAPPSRLVARIEEKLAARTPLRRRWPITSRMAISRMAGLAAACVLVAGALGLVLREPPGPGPAPDPAPALRAPPGMAAPLSGVFHPGGELPRARVSFPRGSGVVTVPIRSTSSDVSIVFVYPSVSASGF